MQLGLRRPLTWTPPTGVETCGRLLGLYPLASGWDPLAEWSCCNRDHAACKARDTDCWPFTEKGFRALEQIKEMEQNLQMHSPLALSSSATAATGGQSGQPGTKDGICVEGTNVGSCPPYTNTNLK